MWEILDRKWRMEANFWLKEENIKWWWGALLRNVLIGSSKLSEKWWCMRKSIKPGKVAGTYCEMWMFSFSRH
ncbi:unnamed protein product [Blepharisma stoltei]|uniref:Uncharacterized protein n=1 Tax=Blepharisma stoltei TaxID=1481888 RepID=A0AAU9JD66_9CILI|nr:unnamed protein product [Blepharisma stoltei]